MIHHRQKKARDVVTRTRRANVDQTRFRLIATPSLPPQSQSRALQLS